MTTTTEPISLADRREQIYFKLAAGEQLTIDEIGNIADVPKDEIEAETRRAAAVLKHRPLAGSAEEREAAKRQLAKSEARLADESPKLADAIAELQRQQQELAHAVKTSAALVEARARAVDQLRRNAPPHIVKYYQTATGLLNSQPQSRRMRELKSRVRKIAGVFKIDVATRDGQEAAKMHAQNNKPELLDVTKHGNTRSFRINPQRWATYIGQLKAELPRLERELANLEAEYAAGLAEIDATLNHYVP